MVFKKVERAETLSKQIVMQIKDAIRKKTFEPGEKLPSENEMCEMFGASRTAVREAISMLNAHGLVNVEKGKGAYVNEYHANNITKPMSLFLELNLDIDYIIHLIKIRKMLEPEIARAAALNRSKEDLDRLEEIMKDFQEADPQDYKTEAKIDKDFHLTLANTCKNPLIPIITEPIYEIMPKMKSIILKNVDIARSDADRYHHKIYEMVKNQDGDGAYKMMNKHLELATEHAEMIKRKKD